MQIMGRVEESPGVVTADGFLWGAATSAYQIEGAVGADGGGTSIWDDFAGVSGNVHNGDTATVACDHYHRWDADLDLAAWMGLDAYRLGVSWARLQPAGSGELNPTAVGFYRRLLGGCHQRGIRPFLTLYHWDLPSPLEAAGGWPERDTAHRFADFARRVVTAVGDLVDDIITVNEPWCASFLGYGEGAHAPGRRHVEAAVRSAHHLNLGHGLAVRAIREIHPGAAVGITNLLTDVEPASESLTDRAAAARVDANANRMFLSPVYTGDYDDAVHDLYRDRGLADAVRPGDLDIVAAPTDFAGVNHYHHHLVRHVDGAGHLDARITDAEPAPTSLGWSIAPESLRSVVERAADISGLPVYVTENGAAYADEMGSDGTVDDTERIAYHEAYTSSITDAVADGVDIRGYFAWSLLDNFEWAEGYSQRFGLVHVDFDTQRRTPKASAYWYRDHIERHRTRRTTQSNTHPMRGTQP